MDRSFTFKAKMHKIPHQFFEGIRHMRRIFGASRQSKEIDVVSGPISTANYLTGNVPSMRAEGDTARDNRDWALAQDRYTAHLAIKPTDMAIWVQLGHALKEQNRFSEAEVAYRRAIELAPENADAHLQLGHVLKLQSKRSDAIKAYSRSLEIEPSRDAFQELSSIGNKVIANKILMNSSASTVHVLYFEIDDLLGWLRAHRTLSGIQRVQVGIIRAVLQEMQRHDGQEYAFVRTRNDNGTYWRMWPDDLRQIIEYTTSSMIDQQEQIHLLNRAEQAAVQVTPYSKDCYFILGAFWGFNGDASRYARLKRAGVTVGVYIYDLIPMTHPEYCDAHLVSDFALSLGDGLAIFDFVLTISEFTAQEVRRLQTKLNLQPIPVEAVLLAHVLSEDLDGPVEPTWTPNIVQLRHRRFVMSVSTIEARKNHPYLFSAWRLMLEEGLDPPDLVFVGRYGWRVTDFMEQMKATNFLEGRIHVLHDLSDAELKTLYQSCQFTVFPSFVEGWGLPVGESLTHSKPCVAANTSSIPEVGGDLVDYIDPYNVRNGVEVLRRMSFDDTYRVKREQAVREGFVARTWPNVTSNLLSSIQRLRKSPANADIDPLLQKGELFLPSEVRLGHLVPKNYASRPLRSILAESWYTPEAMGAWMRGQSALLRFKTGLAANVDVVVYLRLAGTPWSVNQKIRAVIGESEDLAWSSKDRLLKHEINTQYPRQVQVDKGLNNIIDGPFIVRVDGTTAANGIVALRIRVSGKSLPVPVDEPRLFSIGLIGMAYAERADTELRSDIVDAMASQR